MVHKERVDCAVEADTHQFAHKPWFCQIRLALERHHKVSAVQRSGTGVFDKGVRAPAKHGTKESAS
jgi:hypothetical protein